MELIARFELATSSLPMPWYDDPVYEVDRQSILRISDRVKELKDVECRSAYIITLIILWQQCNAKLSNELIHMRYSGLYMHDEKNNEDVTL